MRNGLKIQTGGGRLIRQQCRLTLDREKLPGFRHGEQLQTLIFILRMAGKRVALPGMLAVCRHLNQDIRDKHVAPLCLRGGQPQPSRLMGRKPDCRISA